MPITNLIPAGRLQTRGVQIRAIGLALMTFAAARETASQDLTSKADEYLTAESNAGRFSGSVLIAKDGKVLFSKGYGLANIELDVPNTTQTKFRLGSVTKQFTSMAIMILQERGKLSVQDPVSKYVPDSPEAWRDVTLHHLLTHTAGIPDFKAFPDYLRMVALPSSTKNAVARFKDKPLDFKPGERFSYSNSGYILLGYIIELVTGGTYEDFLRRNIFDPLGMSDSGYDHHETILSHRATGYANPDGKPINAPYMDMSNPHGAGALYSTAEDLLKWDQALYTDKLVPQKSLDAIFTPFKNNYAYGWMVMDQFNRKEISHGGQIIGFSCYIARYPEDRVLVVVLSNFGRTKERKISLDLAGMVFNEKPFFPKRKKGN